MNRCKYCNRLVGANGSAPSIHLNDIDEWVCLDCYQENKENERMIIPPVLLPPNPPNDWPPIQFGD